MPRTTQTLFALQSAALDGDPAQSAERSLNMYAEIASSQAYAPHMNRQDAGLAEVANLGGPVRSLLSIDEVLYVAAGGRLWRYDGGSTVTDLGAVPDAAAMFLAGSDTQIAILSGSDLYVYERVTGNIDPVTQDSNGQPLPDWSSLSYIDGYGLLSAEGDDQFYITNLLDFTDINALDFASAETSADNLLRVFVDHREVWLFGPQTTEVWYNSGDATFPFSRANEASMERGLAGKFAVTKEDNTVFWLGDDLIIYAAAGYRPTRISTHAIERKLTQLDAAQLSQIRAFSYTDDGNKFIVFWLPTGPAWKYNTATKLWNERSSQDCDPWIATDAARFAFDDYFGGYDGVLYCLDRTQNGDGARSPFLRELISVPVHDGDNRFKVNFFRADCKKADGTVKLAISDDRGETWKLKGGKSMKKDRQFWRNLGQTRHRLFRLQCTDDVEFGVYGAHIKTTYQS